MERKALRIFYFKEVLRLRNDEARSGRENMSDQPTKNTRQVTGLCGWAGSLE